MGKFPGPCGRRRRPLNSHKLQPDEIPDKSGEVVMKKVTKNPTKQLFAIDSCWERKMSIFFNGVSLSIQTTLQASPHARVAGQPKKKVSHGGGGGSWWWENEGLMTQQGWEGQLNIEKLISF